MLKNFIFLTLLLSSLFVLGDVTEVTPVGQTTMSNSLPVAIASDQSSVPVTFASPVPVTFASPVPVTFSTPIPVTQSTSPWVVSGTVTSNQGTSPWVDNVSQFGGNNVVTGTGASGLGIPRVTVSNDSNILATQSGAWTTGRTWNLLNTTDSVNAVQSGTWTVQQGSPPWSVSQSGSWTVTSNQGTSPWITKDQSDGPVTPGAAASFSMLSGMVYPSATPSPSPGQQMAMTSDSAGRLVVDGSQVTQPISGTITSNQGTSPWVDNISQFGGNNVVTGTGASGVGIPRVTVSNDSNILATQSGTWNINNITGTVSLPTGASTSANQTNGTQQTQIVQGGNTATITASSALKVDGSAVTQPVSQVTSPWVTKDQSDGPVTPGTAASFSMLSGMVYPSATPSPSPGQQMAMTSDASGRLVVDGGQVNQPVTQVTSPWVTNITQFGSNNVVTGTGNSGVGIPRVTVSNDSSITNITGTVSLPTNAAQETGGNLDDIDLNTDNLNLAQGSTTSGQHGPLIQGAVTTAAPTYVTAQTDPFSLTTSGAIRSDWFSVGGTAYTLGSKVSSSSAPVVIASDQSPIEVELFDSAENGITSQANGTQRALDVGIDVAGVQIDPRITGVTNITQPTAEADASLKSPGQDAYHRSFSVSEVSSDALWGKLFRVTSNNTVTIGVTTETAFFLFRNPNASGVNCKFKRREYGSVGASGGNAIIYKAYRDATVTANGTALTSVGGRNTSQATAQCLATTSPTVTANGTVFDVDRASTSDDVRDDDFSFWVEPNHNILITVTANATGLNPTFELDWAEQ